MDIHSSMTGGSLEEASNEKWRCGFVRVFMECQLSVYLTLIKFAESNETRRRRRSLPGPYTVYCTSELQRPPGHH